MNLLIDNTIIKLFLSLQPGEAISFSQGTGKVMTLAMSSHGVSRAQAHGTFAGMILFGPHNKLRHYTLQSSSYIYIYKVV